MNWRFKSILGVVFVLGFCIIARLFELQVLGHNFLGNTVYQKNITQELIPAERGRIFISEGTSLLPLAINIKNYNLIVSPNEIVSSDIKVEDWLEKVSPFLDIKHWQNLSQEPLFIEEDEETTEFKEMLNRLSKKDDFYEIIKKDLIFEQKEEIEQLNLPGLRFETITKRYYPENNLFSHITGFVRSEENCQDEDCLGGQGQYGLEEFFNQELAGEPGEKIGEKGKNLTGPTDNFIKLPERGVDLVLTIDRTIQFFVCQTLRETIKEYQADSGSIIILNPKSGEIIALCNYPDFDPNNYSKVKDYAVYKNEAVSSAFEPGSIFKVITMASGIDSKKVSPETVYLDKGQLIISGEKISNSDNRIFGLQNMTEVLEKSINTGAIFVAQKLGRSGFRNYLKKFGFGSLTQMEIPDESSGDISNLDEKQEIYLATASFGQGIIVTPIQMINAVAAIANQGKLMKPHLVKMIIKNGEEIPISPNFVRQVISPSSAATLKAMMTSVCENGYGSRARVNNYYVGGKTGTAQVPQENSAGYSEKVIHSFVGFAPSTDPRFVVLIKFDNPQNGRFADSTAAPTFSKITEFILKYYNIPPDKMNK